MAQSRIIPHGTLLRVTKKGLEVLPEDAAVRLVSRSRTDGRESVAPASHEVPESGAFYPDDHSVWRNTSNGSRAHGASCADPDVARAAVQEWSPVARGLVRVLLRKPGVTHTSPSLGDELGLEGPNAVAGALNGFVKAHDDLGIAFPFAWWERQDGSTLFAIRPSVAEGLTEALNDFTEPIEFKSDRWYRELVQACLKYLREIASEGRTVQYARLAEELKNRVPGARLSHRGRSIGQLLEAVLTAQDRVEENLGKSLPLLTAVVVLSSGQPSSGFWDMADARNRRREGEADTELWERTMAALPEAWDRPEVDEVIAKVDWADLR